MYVPGPAPTANAEATLGAPAAYAEIVANPVSAEFALADLGQSDGGSSHSAISHGRYTYLALIMVKIMITKNLYGLGVRFMVLISRLYMLLTVVIRRKHAAIYKLFTHSV